MTLNEFTAAVREYTNEHPEQRQGQALSNMLLVYRKDIADKIHGTINDPFYSDIPVADAWKFIMDNW